MSRALDVQGASRRRTRRPARPDHTPRPPYDKPRRTQARRTRRIVLFVSAIVGTGLLGFGIIADLHLPIRVTPGAFVAAGHSGAPRTHGGKVVVGGIHPGKDHQPARRVAGRTHDHLTRARYGKSEPDVGLATRHLLDLPGVHQHQLVDSILERVPHGLQNNSGRLHHRPGYPLLAKKLFAWARTKSPRLGPRLSHPVL